MIRSLVAAAALALVSSTALAQPIPDAAPADMDALMALYRDLHANPELSLHETATAARLAGIAREAGLDVTQNVGGTGVVAVLRNGEGPTLLIRADMDGLPVTEQTGLPFASQVRTTTEEGVETGVMHACGHDTHMTAWVGTMRRLAALKDRWSGTLVMIAQPAEEVGKGARMMLEDGLFTRFPRPTHAIAFHDTASAPAGVIGLTPGYALANVDSVDIRVRGVGGHGAYPHTTRDPVVLGSRIVTSLQTLVSRELDPQTPAVVTVGSFHAGSKHNIISDEALLQLTVRSYAPEVRQQLLDGIARIARGEAIAAGMPEDLMPEVRVKDEYTPSTYNTPELSERLLSLFGEQFGEERVVQATPVMGGEDFGRYRLADESIQSVIFWVGGVPLDRWQAAQAGEATLPSLHSPYWAPDAEAVIATASEALTAAALDILGRS
ncbi:amidohydrolase [Sphingosinithalassobacter sp. LHW66-3]|uniref:amidohydrolase n=1 Tax=Sphingosinithalassobacter sp. LHW66-3 TaxID=3424718 RepID=UPI003D6AFC26